MSDEERAREIADFQPCVRSTCQRLCMECRAELRREVLSALAAARAEEREACARLADDYEKDSCGNDCMGGCADCAWFTARREIAAAIRGRM